MGTTLMTGVYGVNDQLRDMLERGDASLIDNEMPDEWLDWLAICGEPDECVEQIRALLDAGASSVDLAFVPATATREQMELTASENLAEVGIAPAGVRISRRRRRRSVGR